MPKIIISIGVAFIFVLFPFKVTTLAETGISQTVDEYYENPDASKEKETPSKIEAKDSSFSLIEFGKMIITFIFVILLLLLVLKWIQKQSLGNRKRGALELVGTLAVGQNKSVQLVKVGKQIVLLGVGDSITYIKEFQDEKEIEDILNAADSVNVVSKKSIANPETLLQFKKQMEEINTNRKDVLRKFSSKGGNDRE